MLTVLLLLVAPGSGDGERAQAATSETTSFEAAPPTDSSATVKPFAMLCK